MTVLSVWAMGCGRSLVKVLALLFVLFATGTGCSAVSSDAPRLAAAGVVVVAESGIFTHEDVQRLEAAGAHAVLVGESLMREPDVGRALARLRGRP